MELFFFHLMPWPEIPGNFRDEARSSWVVLSHRHYDPALGHRVYNDCLDELEFAEQVGFDAICVNEHHQNAYGLMPAPNIMAAALVRRTSRARIAILGNGISLRDNPLRIAEEIAMLDVISGGRVISGFVRGIGCEYFSLGLDPTQSRERFQEAHDLIIKAWTAADPFTWDGKHFHFRYVNVWPRPFQKPHPPIFCPSQGSSETIEWAAERGYPYVCTYTPIEALLYYYDRYRELAETRFSYHAGPEKFGVSAFVYVAEDEATAIEHARQHVKYFGERCFAIPLQMLIPPGYASSQSLRHLVGARGPSGARFDFDFMVETGQTLFGTPEQVGERLTRLMERAGAEVFMGLFQFGNMPHARAMRSIELFANRVMPYLPRTQPIGVASGQTV